MSRVRANLVAVLTAAIAVVAVGCGGSDADGDDAGGTPSTTGTTTTATVSTTTTTTTTATTTTTTTTTTAASTTTVADAGEIDWGTWTYAAECGIVDELELVDGEFRPAEYNEGDGTLVVSFVSAEDIPTRPDHTLVRLDCEAGGASGALSSQLYFVMHTGPDDVEQQLVMIGEPDAVHVVNEGGTVVVTDTTYGANDPNCCPSVFRSRQIVWTDDGPVEIAGSLPDAEPVPVDPAGCVSSELEAGWPDASEVLVLETALLGAGFDPGTVDGDLDDDTIAAVVRLIEFNAGNPAIARSGDRPYENLHAEASRHGVIREPVLTLLEVACDDLAWLPAR